MVYAIYLYLKTPGVVRGATDTHTHIYVPTSAVPQPFQLSGRDFFNFLVFKVLGKM
jgi:hypothetical protein